MHMHMHMHPCTCVHLIVLTLELHSRLLSLIEVGQTSTSYGFFDSEALSLPVALAGATLARESS
jgi:hypothetical protein